MKKNIALINPNSPFLINERVFPNMGLVRVATQLQKDGHKVDLYDFAGRNESEINTKIENIAHNYDIYGFSSTTPQFPYIMKIFNKLKESNPNAKTIIGGAHVSALYHLREKKIKDVNINDLEVFDTIFAGEGEDTAKIFGDGWQKGKIIKNIDDVLIPDRKFLDMNSYDYKLFGHSTTSIQTQRGCPHKCTFCSGRDIEMYNRIRTHSPKRVLQEMDELHEEYGFESYMWYDDEININIGRLEKLCGELKKRPYQHRGFVRSDNIVKYPDSVKWMKDAGFVKLCTGVESGSDRMLRNDNKKTTSKMNSIARELIKNQGIHYEAFTLLGHPDEKIEDVIDTYNWLIENKPDDFDINIITPYPGSKIYDDAKPSKKFNNYKWEFNGLYFNKPRYSQEDSFYKGHDGLSESNIRTNNLTNRQLKILRNEIEEYIRK